MAQQSLALTRKRFGNTVSLYIPFCTYLTCALTRARIAVSQWRTVSSAERLLWMKLMLKARAIKKMKFDSVLLVTGEHETQGWDELLTGVAEYQKQFNYLAMQRSHRSTRLRRT